MDELLVKNSAFVNGCVARALIRMEGMKAENKRRELHGEALAYTEDDFLSIINEEQIDWNTIIMNLNQGY